MPPSFPPELERQVKVSKLLGFGFGITMADRSGIAAPFAIVFGLRARRLIKSSDAPLSGIVMAWWCILIGSYNAVIGAINLLYLLVTLYQP
jgi:hypothetical protein